MKPNPHGRSTAHTGVSGHEKAEGAGQGLMGYRDTRREDGRGEEGSEGKQRTRVCG